ncbi:hypothetical protein QTO34_009476, partial [Cnephaeus nilssonii]
MQSFIEKYHPDKEVENLIINLFNDNAVFHFRQVLNAGKNKRHWIGTGFPLAPGTQASLELRFVRKGQPKAQGKPRMLAAQPMPEVQASLRWRLPSRPEPPEAQ